MGQFFRECSLAVVVVNYDSETGVLNCGVVRGSVCEPLLFLLSLWRLVPELANPYFTYADDVRLVPEEIC